MPIFECQVARTVFLPGLELTQTSALVLVEASDSKEAYRKAQECKNWRKPNGAEGNLFTGGPRILTVKKVRPLTHAEVEDLHSKGLPLPP